MTGYVKRLAGLHPVYQERERTTGKARRSLLSMIRRHHAPKKRIQFVLPDIDLTENTREGQR